MSMLDAIAIFAAMLFAWTTVAPSPTVTETASSSVITCRIDQFIATMSIAPNTTEDKSHLRRLCLGACGKPQLAPSVPR